MATPNNTPCGNIGGIDFEEPEESGELDIGGGEARGTRVFHVDWNDRNVFITELMGGVITNGENEIYTNPKSFPGFNAIRCRQVNVRGLGTMSAAGNGDFVYPFAKITATYRLKDDDDDNQTNEDIVLKTEEMDFSFDEHDIEPMTVRFSGTGRELSEKLEGVKRSILITHTITEEKSPTDKKSIIRLKAGKINTDTFLGVEAGKLLYMGAKTRRVILASGEQPYKITHTFIERVDASWLEDWDSVVDGSIDPRWDFLERVDGGEFNKYEETNFGGSGLVG